MGQCPERQLNQGKSQMSLPLIWLMSQPLLEESQNQSPEQCLRNDQVMGGCVVSPPLVWLVYHHIQILGQKSTTFQTGAVEGHPFPFCFDATNRDWAMEWGGGKGALAHSKCCCPSFSLLLFGAPSLTGLVLDPRLVICISFSLIHFISQSC